MTLLQLDLVRSCFERCGPALLVGLSPPDVTSRPNPSLGPSGQADNRLSLCDGHPMPPVNALVANGAAAHSAGRASLAKEEQRNDEQSVP